MANDKIMHTSSYKITQNTYKNIHKETPSKVTKKRNANVRGIEEYLPFELQITYCILVATISSTNIPATIIDELSPEH